MSDLVLNVRQVSSYPLLPSSDGGEAVLVQVGGLGGAYQTLLTSTLVSTALNDGGSLGVGTAVPGGASAGHVFAANVSVLPLDGSLLWNCYWNGSQFVSWGGGAAGSLGFGNGLLTFDVASGAAAAPLVFTTVLELTLAGAAALPYGTLTVARDPAAAMEVATLNWVSNNTVASFNNRRGAVTLTVNDIYSTLGLCSKIATEAWVTEAITSGINSLLSSHPFVFCWNGRTGSVFMTLSDITCVFFQSGQQPITPTPPSGSNDYSIANTAWVSNYVSDIITGEIDSKGLATQAWVQANTVASFNNRIGAVTLQLTDITVAGGAPANSPNFTGIPTGPTANFGQATAQLATTAFVQAAVQASVTGVVSWNNRTGAVTLTGQDIYDAGGALMASPAFTGTPTAPTAAPATATTQLATTAFVMNEVAATTAGVASFNTRTGAVTLQLADITGVGGAPVNSPSFTGTPQTVTPLSPVAATSDIANTSWVVNYFGVQQLNLVSSFNGRSGAVTLTANDLSAAGALVNPSPALTGQPTAPTAVPGTATTQLATTAFVTAAIAALSGVTVSPTPPASPYLGQAWFNSTTGVQQLSIWTGSGWTVSTNLSGVLSLGGGTLTGPLQLSGNASAPLNPVALQQMQAALAGYLPLAGGTLSGSLTVNSTIFATGSITSPSLAVSVAAGNNAAVLSNVSGVRQWWSGTGSNGNYNIVDATGGVSRLGIDTVGNFSFAGNGTFSGSVFSSGLINANGALQTASTGVVYSAWGAHAFAFNWDGTYIGAFVDGNWIGSIQIIGSDARMKRNVRPVEVDALARVNAIRLHAFERVTADQRDNPDAKGITIPVGYIAQELREIMPDAITDTELLGVDLVSLCGYLIGSVQQLTARVKDLEAVRH